MSDSGRPFGLQPARLLCPRDSPGENTGVGCHFLQGIFPTHGSSLHLLCLLHWQVILYHWCHLGSPICYGALPKSFLKCLNVGGPYTCPRTNSEAGNLGQRCTYQGRAMLWSYVVSDPSVTLGKATNSESQSPHL